MSSIFRKKVSGVYVTYPMADGSVYRDYYNETLDNGTVILSQVANFSVLPYEEIEISLDGTNFLKFLAVDIIKSVASFLPPLYNYTITFISRTAILQKIVLPNISVTQRIGTENKIDIRQKLVDYYDDYGTRYRSSTGHPLKYPISTRLSNFTDNVVCPEFTLQQPTLFQVLNLLLSPLNSVITINQSGELDYIDLTVTGQNYTSSDFSEVTSNIIGSEYANELVSELSNVVGDEVHSATETAWITMRAPEGEIEITTDNAVISTQQPIYKILKLELDTFAYTSANKEGNIFRFQEPLDLTDVVVEKSKYDIMGTDTLVDVYDENQKRWHLYYEIGGKEIYGYGRQQSWWTSTTYQSITKAIVENLGLGVDTALTFSRDEEDWIRTARFKVTYIPIASSKISTSKLLPFSTKIEIPNNQSDNLVDADRFALSNYQTVNRIGNENIETMKRYENLSQVPLLGSVLDSTHILFEREIAVHDNYVVFKGEFSKDFTEKTFFTGVNAKRRMFSLAQINEAVERHDVQKIYAEFSFVNKNEVGFGTLSYNQSGKTFSNYLFSGLGYSSASTAKLTSNSVKVIGAVVEPEIDSAVPQKKLFMEVTKFLADRSVLLTISFDDNYSAGGKQIVLGGNVYEDFVPYTDTTFGELVNLNIKFVKYISDGILTAVADQGSKPTPTVVQSFYNQIKQQSFDKVLVWWFLQGGFYNDTVANNNPLPELTTGMANSAETILEINTNRSKDNREVIKQTVQTEFCVDTENIVVTSKMAQYSGLLAGKDMKTNTRLVYSTSAKYKWYETKGKGTTMTQQPLVFTSNQCVINTSILNSWAASPGTNNIQSWALVDLDNNVIFAVNKVGTAQINTTLYLNALRSREPF
jgi:hypothetical protein